MKQISPTINLSYIQYIVSKHLWVSTLIKRIIHMKTGFERPSSALPYPLRLKDDMQNII